MVWPFRKKEPDYRSASEKVFGVLNSLEGKMDDLVEDIGFGARTLFKNVVNSVSSLASYGYNAAPILYEQASTLARIARTQGISIRDKPISFSQSDNSETKEETDPLSRISERAKAILSCPDRRYETSLETVMFGKCGSGFSLVDARDTNSFKSAMKYSLRYVFREELDIEGFISARRALTERLADSDSLYAGRLNDKARTMLITQLKTLNAMMNARITYEARNNGKYSSFAEFFKSQQEKGKVSLNQEITREYISPILEHIKTKGYSWDIGIYPERPVETRRIPAYQYKATSSASAEPALAPA